MSAYLDPPDPHAEAVNREMGTDPVRLGANWLVQLNRAPAKLGPNLAAKQQVIVRMDPALHQALKAKAAEDERSMAAAIRYAIRCYINGGGFDGG